MHLLVILRSDHIVLVAKAAYAKEQLFRLRNQYFGYQAKEYPVEIY